MNPLLKRRRMWGLEVTNPRDLMTCPGLLRDDPPADGDSTDGDGGGDPPPPKDDKDALETRIAESVGRTLDATNAGIAKLMANPHVKAILEAQERGESIKVVTGKDADDDDNLGDLDFDIPKGDGDDKPSPLDEMTNVQLVGFITKGLSDKLGKRLDDRFGRIERVVGYLQDRDGEIEDRQIADSLTSVRAKYPDFDAYNKEVIAIGKESPRLKLEEMYLLARIRKGDGPPTPRTTDSERPTGETGGRRRAGDDDNKKPIKLRHGRRGFAEMLSEATDNVAGASDV